MWELKAHPQHYSWGSADALPSFLGRVPDGRPWAELWYGAHPLGPSTLAGEGLPLDREIARRPRALLGDGVARAFAEQLPFMLKVIAPARPLSLQVHPTREHAEESFAAENAAGLSLDAPHRNYRDDNHKPEMVLALERFEALCGFRTPRRAASIVAGLDTSLTTRLHALLTSHPTAHGMRAAFRTLVAPSLRPTPALVEEVADACRARLDAGDSPSPRIDRAVGALQDHFPGDPGVVAALLLNPVTLQPGEAMFVPPGAMHAYLSGLGIEVMAASDNVLRAGLTPKRVDADEVLQCVSVQAAPPLRVAPERLTDATVAYYAPIDDFELTVTTLKDPPGQFHPRRTIPGTGPRILLAVEGDMLLESDAGRRRLDAGRALFVPADAGHVRLGGRGRLVQAGVP
ncbi:MAG: mannose-6-phosphate isomerase, class I [Brachybacterium sp.]|nr:mannose-6-phosphate isomerase, class I [Brachybacterium sp.]